MLPLPPEIVAGRIVLRPHKNSDLERFTEFIIHPDSTRYMLIPEDRKTAAGAAGMLRGTATRAAQALAQHVLGSEHATKIVAFISPENTPSVRVTEKARFVCEGPAIHHGRNALRFSIASPVSASVADPAR